MPSMRSFSGGERIGASAFEVQDADKAIFDKERDDQFGADIFAVRKFDIARVLADIVHADNFAMAGGVARDAFKKRNAQANGESFFVLDAEDAFELGGLFIPEKDAEEVIVEMALSDRRCGGRVVLARVEVSCGKFRGG